MNNWEILKGDYWKDFKGAHWKEHIDVNEFILNNYTEYLGSESFLSGISDRNNILLQKIQDLFKKEKIKQNIDASIVSSITAYRPGYIDKDNEIIVGLQTDEPLKRAFMPFGGIRIAEKAVEANGYSNLEINHKIFTEYRKTHNEAVFDVYTPEIRKCRRNHIITGLPDGYSRGRIIGDYRRISLYGVDLIIESKQQDFNNLDPIIDIELRENIAEQIKSLKKLKEMAASYGFDISKPAKNFKEAVQWLYFGYLAATKEQNGAAMSLGRVSTFLDIYAERDLKNGVCTESEIQEIVDQFVLKLRCIRFARTPEYNEIFAGDPVWITESIGGMVNDEISLVTKNSFRFLHTLENLGAAPEPNLTVLWDENLPENFKKYCAKISYNTSAIQYENDKLMRKCHGNDYAIACCVSSAVVGKEMQYFGARANLAKCLLYAINGGKDEISGEQVGPTIKAIDSEFLDYEEVKNNFILMLNWLVKVYATSLNIIHYMHDKYNYESLQMSLIDSKLNTYFATGIAGFSVVVDSLSAIKYAKVYPIKNSEGLIIDYKIVGDYPKFGNDDDRVDEIADWVLTEYINKLYTQKTYRNSIPTVSILTITSNIVYGKNTGATPDGRKAGEPFAPGANPMAGRETHGALAALNSLAKLSFYKAQDGISNTFSLAKTRNDNLTDINNIITIIDGYMNKGGHHINVNILDKETLLLAQKCPELYPNLTIRVSGYAVNFVKLTKEQQDEVISRTFY